MNTLYMWTTQDNIALNAAISAADASDSFAPITNFVNSYSAASISGNGVLYSGYFDDGAEAQVAANDIANQTGYDILDNTPRAAAIRALSANTSFFDFAKTHFGRLGYSGLETNIQVSSYIEQAGTNSLWDQASRDFTLSIQSENGDIIAATPYSGEDSIYRKTELQTILGNPGSGRTNALSHSEDSQRR